MTEQFLHARLVSSLEKGIIDKMPEDYPALEKISVLRGEHLHFQLFLRPERTENYKSYGYTVAVEGIDAAAYEVLQVYAEHPSSPFDTLHPSLCGFKRVYVGAGESGSAEVELGAWDTVVDGEGRRVKAPAVLWAGLCQNDGRSIALSGSAPLRVK